MNTVAKIFLWWKFLYKKLMYKTFALKSMLLPERTKLAKKISIAEKV